MHLLYKFYSFTTRGCHGWNMEHADWGAVTHVIYEIPISKAWGRRTNEAIAIMTMT